MTIVSTHPWHVTLSFPFAVFIYPWGNVNKPTPNHDAIEAPLGKLQHVIGYRAMGPGDNFYGAASGATDDAMYALFGPLSMTWELGSAFHERCEDFDKELPYLLQGLEYLASIAPAPYTLGQGPDITEATAVPSVIQEGETLTLTVTASDSSKQSMDVSTAEQSVVELRLYLDHPLVVGNENSLALAVWNVNDSGWTVADDDGGVSFTTSVTWEDLFLARGAGSHSLYVQALDSDGHWGPVATMPIQLKSREGSLPESKSPTTPTPVAAVASSSTQPSPSPSMQPSLSSSSSPSIQPSALSSSSSNTIPAEANRLSTPSPTDHPEEPRTSVVPSVEEEAPSIEPDVGDAGTHVGIAYYGREANETVLFVPTQKRFVVAFGRPNLVSLSCHHSPTHTLTHNLPFLRFLNRSNVRIRKRFYKKSKSSEDDNGTRDFGATTCGSCATFVLIQ